MTKKISKYLLAVVFAFVCLLGSIPAQAAETNTLYVQVKCDPDVKLQRGDTFKLTYGVFESETTATMTLDAYAIGTGKGTVELNKEKYYFYEIHYEGKQGLKNYAVNRLVDLQKKSDTLTIYIGEDSIKDLADDAYAFSEDATVSDDSYGSSGTSVYSSVYDNAGDNTEADNSSQEEERSVWSYNNSHPWRKAIPLLCFIGLTLLLIWILVKKGKLTL